MIRRLLLASLLSGVIVLCFFQFYHFLKARIITSDLKKVTEGRISAFLKVPVKVDQITVGLLKHISLSGLKIERTRKGFPLLIGVKKIVIRYDLLSLIKRNFRIPTEIFLDTPRLTLQAFQSPDTIFDTNILKSEHGILTRFEFEDGEIQMPWFGSEATFSLVGIEGKAIPKKGDLFDVRFKANLAGGFKGAVLAYGEVNPETKMYHLELSLSDISATKDSQIPLSDLKGIVEFEHDTVRIRNMSFLFRGIPCEMSGEVQHIFSPKPVFHLSLKIKEGTIPIHSQMDANFETGTVSGFIEYAAEKYQFAGILEGLPMNFKIPAFKLNSTYDGSAQFDSQKNMYWLELIYKHQRFRLNFSFKGLTSKLQFKLDHFDLFGFDLVSFVSINLKPFEEEWQKGNHVFEAQIQTEYLIFHFQPLRDFKGTAHLSLRGIHDLSANWGSVSRVNGEIRFGQVPQANLNLIVGPVNLEEFDYLGNHRLPSSLTGRLEGRLNAQGPLSRLYLNGMLTIADGKVGSLKYDTAEINFSGYLPYLALKDSKVLKGKNTFGLKGGFNFALQNFMKGVQVDNSEHIVVWRGLEMSSELEDANAVRKGTNTLGQIQAEYQFSDRTSLHVKAEKDQSQTEYVGVGPKLKF